jgi:hypothetical protein
MPAQKMAVVEGRGVPATLFSELAPALYQTVYALEAELNKTAARFKPGALRARYPEISKDPADWRIIIGTPVPDGVTSLPQVVPGLATRLEIWSYGTVAQIMHYGSYDAVEAAMTKLQEFVADNGYVVCGPYEEEYLSGPEAKVPRTIVRFEVKKR